ncbi:MEMO1 family [Coniochaeta sp. 2T2.1]|nr:MEMO1 family [Coniochaeta sp. 2T2.1]
MAAKPLKGRREASHAGSWYVGNPDRLSAQLDDYLDQVPNAIDGVDLPVPGARVIIAPHAGYRYSGPCAAWAYKSLDLSPGTKRVFVLGPSHTYSLSGCALTIYAELETPLGNLTVDQAVLNALQETNQFPDQPRGKDVQEHSIEMHLPYLVKRLQQTFGSDSSSKWPTVVPILVGSNNAAGERKFGDLLLPYLKDPANAFIVSSDFCHWGGNFDYYAYFTRDDKLSFRADHQHDVKTDGPISKSIDRLDGMAIEAVESGRHDKFVENLRQTKNTVCGRHPIGVLMAALEKLREEEGKVEEGNKGRFKKVKYDRSQDLVDAEGSSVSYVSFYAVL